MTLLVNHEAMNCDVVNSPTIVTTVTNTEKLMLFSDTKHSCSRFLNVESWHECYQESTTQKRNATLPIVSSRTIMITKD